MILFVPLRHVMRIVLTATVLLGMSAGYAMADDNQTTSSGANTVKAGNGADDMVVRRIGLIDIDGVLRASTGIIRVRELLDEQRLAFQKEFTVKETALQKTERALLANQNVISQEEFDAQLADFQDEVAELQRQIQYRRQSLDVAYQEAQNNLRSLALEIVKDIAGERSLDLVLVRDSALIYVPGLNISDEVLSRLNERTKNARIEIELDVKPEN